LPAWHKIRSVADWHTEKQVPAQRAGTKEKIISFYDGSFLNAFYVCVLLFYDVFFFYHKA
jgi:hypothetical protein